MDAKTEVKAPSTNICNLYRQAEGWGKCLAHVMRSLSGFEEDCDDDVILAGIVEGFIRSLHEYPEPVVF